MKISDFALLWIPLSKSHKRIFRYLQDLSRRYKFVYPAVPTIAKECECSDRTVERATKLFRDRGWLTAKKMGYSSNVYYLINELIKLDLDDPKIYQLSDAEKHELSPRNDAQNVGVSSLLNTNTSTKENSTHIKNASKFRTYHQLNQFSLDFWQKLTLTQHFSEAEISKAIEDYFWYIAEGNKVRNIGGYLYDQAKKARNFYRRAA